MKYILLVEDDIDFANVLKHFLEIHLYQVTLARNGEEAIESFKNHSFDLCIFDVMMPKMDGFTLAEKISRIYPETPFIFLTAKKLKEDRIKGLQLGADDYIIKPFEVDELVLRMQNIIKRSQHKQETETTITKIHIGDYTLNMQRLLLTHNNSTQQLTEKESAIIYYLNQNKNQLLKREQILKAVWGTDDFFSGRSMDVYISKIRKYFQYDSRISIESTRFIGLEFKVRL